MGRIIGYDARALDGTIDPVAAAAAVAFFHSKLYLRILRPNWAALLPDPDTVPPPLGNALDQLDDAIRTIREDAALVA